MGFDFLDWMEYPEDEDLMEGPKEDIVYCYVSTTYLNGFINYVNILGAYMTRRYKSLDKNKNSEDLNWKDSCTLIDRGHAFHTDLSDSYKYDDIHILAECGDYYYYFWSDCDCSDSCMGKFAKSRFESNEQALASFKDEIFSLNIWDAEESYVREHESEYLKYIPKGFFSGWITL